jgi:hypothetical protein
MYLQTNFSEAIQKDYWNDARFFRANSFTFDGEVTPP